MNGAHAPIQIHPVYKKKKIAFSFLLKFSDLCCTFWKVFGGEERLTLLEVYGWV